MTAKHTPGPWAFDLGTGWICGDAKTVARVFERNPAMGFAAAPFRSETDANARLIAAAPELLEALKKTLTLDLEKVDAVNGAGLRKIIRAAIAKTEGREI